MTILRNPDIRRAVLALRRHLTIKSRSVTVGILLSFFVTASILQSILPNVPLIYADDDEDGGSQTDISQDVKQKLKCKVGDFGDPEDSSSSTIGFCNQQGQNNFAGGGSLGNVGIDVGP